MSVFFLISVAARMEDDSPVKVDLLHLNRRLQWMKQEAYLYCPQVSPMMLCDHDHDGRRKWGMLIRESDS